MEGMGGQGAYQVGVMVPEHAEENLAQKAVIIAQDGSIGRGAHVGGVPSCIVRVDEKVDLRLSLHLADGGHARTGCVASTNQCKSTPVLAMSRKRGQRRATITLKST